MRTIALTKGKVAIVDDEDYAWLAVHKWHAIHPRHCYYAARRGRNGSYVYMHREILGLSLGDGLQVVDHCNGDGLDNRKNNLRVATHSQNSANGKTHRNNKSGYKGVYWKGRQKWCAGIRIHGKYKFLGYHPTAEEAARAYDQAAVQLHGSFARTNVRERTT